jgi:hypothetical protein
VDSNFQYAGTGESRHPSFVLPDCLGRVGACPGALGSYDLTREEIWVNLIDRDRPHGLKEPARNPGGASVGVALPDDLDADGMPSIASIGTVTAGAPRIEVGLLKTESPALPRPRGAGPGEPARLQSGRVLKP